MKKIKVVIFARVSTNVQDNQSQIYQLNELAKRNGWKVVKVYSEVVSGYADDSARSQFMELLDDLKTGKVKAQKVLVEEITRLGRKPMQIKQVVQDLNKLKISVFARNLGLETLKADGGEDLFSNFVITIMIELGNLEREVLMNRITRGLFNKASIGNVGGGIFQPYGYKKGPEKKLIINESEAKVVSQVFSLCIKNKWGSQRIARELNLLSIPTKYNLSGKKDPIKYKFGTVDVKDFKWAPNVVLNILKNPIYKGERKFKGHTLPAPAIVDTVTWDMAQLQIAKNKNENPRKSKHQYLLKDVIKCGRCRHNYFGRKRSNLKDNYYMCSSRRVKKNGCKNKGIGINRIEGIIWNLLKFYPDVSDFIKTKSDSKNEHRILMANLEKRKLALISQIKNLGSQLNRSIDLALRSSDPDLQIKFEGKTFEIQSNLNASNIDLQETEFKIIELKSKMNIDASAKESIKFIDRVNSFDQKIEILNHFLESITVLFHEKIKHYQITILFKNGKTLYLLVPLIPAYTYVKTKDKESGIDYSKSNNEYFSFLYTKNPTDPEVFSSNDELFKYINHCMKKGSSKQFGQLAVLTEKNVNYFGKGFGKIHTSKLI